MTSATAVPTGPIRSPRPPHSIYGFRVTVGSVLWSMVVVTGERDARRDGLDGSARFVLLGFRFHGARGPIGLGGLRFGLLRGAKLLGLLTIIFKEAPAFHLGIEHFQGATAGVDLVVMGEIGEPLEDTKQLFVPRASSDLDVAGAALRTEWPEPRQLVAALGGGRYGEAAEAAHQVLRLALAGLARILAKPDANPLAVLRGGREQQFLNVARVGSRAHQLQEPITAVPIAAELDTDRP